jgi:hypothetical protein
VRRNSPNLGLFTPAGHRTCERAQALYGYFHAARETALQIHCARARGDVANSFAENGMREKSGCSGAVADGVAGSFRRLTNHLRPEILLRVPQLNLLGDSHSVVANQRTAELLLNQHAFRLRAKGNTDRIGQDAGPAKNALASFVMKVKLFDWHDSTRLNACIPLTTGASAVESHLHSKELIH